MHSFLILISFLLCNGLMEAAQLKIQELPAEEVEGEGPAPIQTPQTVSRALKKAFASSREIQQMAKEDFIILNLAHSSSDNTMAPHGHYVPRILFVMIENMRQAKALLHTEL